MDDKKQAFERFTRAIANLKLDDNRARPTAHTSSVVDFSNWDAIRREVASTDPVTEEPRN